MISCRPRQEDGSPTHPRDAPTATPVAAHGAAHSPAGVDAKGAAEAAAAEKLRAGNQWRDSGLLFATELGTPVEPRNILRTIELAAEKADLEGIVVHTLRHSAAVAWLESGVHIKAVADLLGHSSIAITGDIYGHTSDDAARAAVERLSGALGL